MVNEFRFVGQYTLRGEQLDIALWVRVWRNSLVFCNECAKCDLNHSVIILLLIGARRCEISPAVLALTYLSAVSSLDLD